jgi:hypothetical protein
MFASGRPALHPIHCCAGHHRAGEVGHGKDLIPAHTHDGALDPDWPGETLERCSPVVEDPAVEAGQQVAVGQAGTMFTWRPVTLNVSVPFV